jgi:hypothetical protein
MASKGTKTSKLFERKSKAKVVEWKAWQHSYATRYVPIKIVTSTSPQISGRDAVRIDIVNQEAVFHDANPQSMEINEPFCIEEDIPKQRRVSSP